MTQPASILLSEEAFVERLRSRSKESFDELYKRYSGALYSVVLRLVTQEDAAQDLLQEAFIKIWKNLESYDASRGRLYTWMMNITRNLCIDYLRSKEFQQSSQNQDIEISVNQVEQNFKVKDRTDHIGIKTLVNQLKPEQKALVDLVYFNGYTQDEAAKTLQIPLGTVKTRLRSAILQLRQYFQEK